VHERSAWSTWSTHARAAGFVIDATMQATAGSQISQNVLTCKRWPHTTYPTYALIIDGR
jgi:hypothetical protein